MWVADPILRDLLFKFLILLKIYVGFLLARNFDWVSSVEANFCEFDRIIDSVYQNFQFDFYFHQAARFVLSKYYFVIDWFYAETYVCEC